MKPNIIAVDFDGTLCENKWPEIGMPNEELIEYLKKKDRRLEKSLFSGQTESMSDWMKLSSGVKNTVWYLML